MGLRPHSLEILLARILHLGGVASAVLIVIGVLMLAPSRAAERTVLDRLFTNGQPHIVRITPGSVLAEALHGRPAAIISLGVLLLILTPVARVIAGALYHLAHHDRTYALISLSVLGLLGAGFVLGRLR
jgi:uncharacterized membrane protein